MRVTRLEVLLADALALAFAAASGGCGGKIADDAADSRGGRDGDNCASPQAVPPPSQTCDTATRTATSNSGQCSYAWYVPRPCSVPTAPAGARLDPATCKDACGTFSAVSCTDLCAKTNSSAWEATSNACTSAGDGVIACTAGQGWGSSIGRRPRANAAEGGARDGTPAVASYFVELARLEAESVRAFRELARDLARHRAPRPLVRAAERAARDEIRHARTMRARASTSAAASTSTSTSTLAPTLEAIALHNAAEGCVRETFGALTATWQAAHAGDRRVRDAMMQIAVEETEHAELSRRIDAWITPRLSRAQRDRVRERRRSAFDELARELAAAPHPSAVLVEAAGVPSKRDALRLLAALRALALAPPLSPT